MTEAKKSTRSPRSAYLPVVPEEWDVHLELTGPGGTVTVQPHVVIDQGQVGYRVQVKTANSDETRTRRVETLDDAFKAAVEGARALDKIVRDSEALVQARANLLGALGDAPEDDA